VDCVTEDYGCDGGLPTHAFKYIMSKGLANASDYPYTGRAGKCNRTAERMPALNISSYMVLPQDENILQLAMYEQGPLSVGIDASMLQFYSSGIITPGPGLCTPPQLDHAVLLTGWGEHKGVRYWTVKNSWSTAWGEKGYFRIERGVGACGVNLMAATAVVNGHFPALIAA
jgi:C1A family cysteine protease